MIYVDDYRVEAKVGRLTARWSHLMVEPGGDLDELHAFAATIGLKAAWFQGPPKHRHPHYDVTDPVRQKAIKVGATSITWREAGQMLAAYGKATREAAAAAAEPVPPTPAPAGAEHPCVVGCPRTDTRPYAEGWRCPDHTPARRRGHPEPDVARYCLTRCYCGECPQCASQALEPITATVLDDNAIRSGKRRSSPAAYQEVRARTLERTGR